MSESHDTGSQKLTDAPAGRGSTRLVVGLILLVGAFYLMVNSMVDGGGAYFLEVDEVMAAEQKGYLKPTRKVRVKGKVVFGTYQNAPGTIEHRFSVQGERDQIRVYYKGAIPDVFKEGGEVVATGSFTEPGLLTAAELTAKCPSKYEQDNISPEARKQMGLERPEEK
ncbi:MAG: cytochrome c maturation protein CcmE [Deltaproteobacteria bacterium]|nr:cytochrome c maturation protein CcmE [Deltaproteobacteria bacterium]